MSSEVKYTGSIGFFGLLTIVFITLKLLGIINWSWVWVLSPLWIDLIITLIIVGIAVIIIKRKDKQEWL